MKTKPSTRTSAPARKSTSTRIPATGKPPVDPDRKKRAGRVLRSLYKHYPDAHCALDYSSPLDLYVATVLSAQCTDERVNKVTPALFSRCREPEDYLSLGREALEGLIRSAGFYRAKTKNILGGCQVIVEKFGGELPRTIEELVTIPGCGRKTANVILGNAFGTTGITVDTHVQRLARRFDLIDEKDPVKIEAELQRLFPEKDWTMLSHMLIWHGRQVCDARSPRCDGCPLRRPCPYPEAVAAGLVAAPGTRSAAKKASSKSAKKTPKTK